MSSPISRRKMITLVSTTSIGFLAGCQELTTSLSQNNDNSGGNNGNIGISSSKSSNKSFPREDASQSGWVHIVSDGESADLTFDIQFCSTVGDVEPNLSNSIGNEYILRFNSSADLSEKSISDNSVDELVCDSVTHLVGGANVPNDWETLFVYVNEIEIQSIKKSGTVPELRSLPNPVQFE